MESGECASSSNSQRASGSRCCRLGRRAAAVARPRCIVASCRLLGGEAVEGEARGVEGEVAAGRAGVGLQVVDAVRHGLARGHRGEVVVEHFLGPLRSGEAVVAEASDERLFLASILSTGLSAVQHCSRKGTMRWNCSSRLERLACDCDVVGLR